MILCSIIIVNYKQPQLVVDCLETIFPNPSSSKFEVIVVDNCSNDDSERIIKKRFPEIAWISMTYNSGFARANNAGIRAAKGELLLLLNSDTLCENNVIVECAERLHESEYVAAGVQLLNPDRSPQISGSFFIAGGLNQLLMLPFLGSLFRWLGYQMKVRKTSVDDAKGIIDVDWINGAFLMVKKDAAERAGLLDEDFFLFFEEIEWCSRLRKVGKMCIYGDLRMVHLLGSTADKAFESTSKGYNNLFDKKGFQIMVSSLLRIRKQYGIGWYIFHLFCYLLTIPVFMVALIVSLPFKPKKRYSFGQFGAYTVNCMKVFWLSGRILLNKPHFYKVL